MKLFAGYDGSNRAVTVFLEDGKVVIEYVRSGRKVFWNDELYSKDQIELIRLSMLNEGYHF